MTDEQPEKPMSVDALGPEARRVVEECPLRKWAREEDRREEQEVRDE